MVKIKGEEKPCYSSERGRRKELMLEIADMKESEKYSSQLSMLEFSSSSSSSRPSLVYRRKKAKSEGRITIQ